MERVIISMIVNVKSTLYRLYLVQLLKVFLLPNKRKSTKQVKFWSCFFSVVQFWKHLGSCIWFLASYFSKWVKIESCFMVVWREIKREVGFILVSTKLLTTFLRHIRHNIFSRLKAKPNRPIIHPSFSLPRFSFLSHFPRSRSTPGQSSHRRATRERVSGSASRIEGCFHHMYQSHKWQWRSALAEPAYNTLVLGTR